jgi:signal transduction histidine kinase
VRTIAEAHGGDAGVADLPQGGADVWITIPTAELAVTMRRQPLGV